MLIVYIILGIVCGVVVIGIISFLLYKFYFQKKRCKKILKDVNSKYEYLHGLLTGQDLQYIERLDIISRTNLFYVDIHSVNFKRYKEIRDTQDQLCQDIIGNLYEFLENKKLKEFKNYYKKNEMTIYTFESMVNELDKNLTDLIKPEEDARNDSLILKDKFREVKSKYNANEKSLEFVSDSFSKVFQLIEKKFNEVDNLIERADYQTINSTLTLISKKLNLLDDIIDILPKMLEEVHEIPSKIDDCVDKYNFMVKNGYPLGHLEVPTLIANLYLSLDEIKGELLNLIVNDVQEKIDSINNLIEKLKKDLSNEIDAKKFFDESFNTVSTSFNELETHFIKINNNMLRFKKVYLIDDEHEKALADIKNTLDSVARDKRKLENYVHNIEKTPYSLLTKYIEDLKNGTSDIDLKLNNFINYLKSLKDDTETGYKNIRLKYEQLKEYECIVRDFLNEDLVLKFSPTFKDCYELIDEINNLISNVPIDVRSINDLNNNLNTINNNLFKSINELKTYKEGSERNIVLINRDRTKFTDVNAQLIQAENAYHNGEYKNSYEISQSILQKLNSRDINS